MYHLKPFLPEMDVSLKGLGVILLQGNSEGNLCAAAFPSHMVKPYKKSMKSYSSAKLKLLVLKWSMCKMFKDDLICSNFTVLMNNNSLICLCTSWLGVS